VLNPDRGSPSHVNIFGCFEAAPPALQAQRWAGYSAAGSPLLEISVSGLNRNRCAVKEQPKNQPAHDRVNDNYAEYERAVLLINWFLALLKKPF